MALIEVLGGTLKAVDCFKLMFLFCQQTKHNYYDFFPYKYGAYSFVLNQDKLRLTDLGYLENSDSFQTTHAHYFFSQLDMFTQLELRSFTDEITLRGGDLLKQVYLDYPYYASKSLVASEILTQDEYKKIDEFKVTDVSPCLFTIGYEGKTIDHYLNELISKNIAVLVDVRKNPISKKYGFSKSQLQKYVEYVGISYVHISELGIPSSMRQNLDSSDAYNNLFNHYTDEILPNQLMALNRLRGIIYEKHRVALTCFEAAYTSCHRSKITDYFQNDHSFDIPIAHL